MCCLEFADKRSEWAPKAIAVIESVGVVLTRLVSLFAVSAGGSTFGSCHRMNSTVVALRAGTL